MAKTRIVSQDIGDSTITDVDVAAANKDGVDGTPSMRTLGPGAGQALKGSSPTAGGTLTWSLGLGAINHILGPSDQNLLLSPGAGRSARIVQGSNVDGLIVDKTAAGAGVALKISNAGTGRDIEGQGGTWFVTPAGAATFTSVTGITDANLGSGTPGATTHLRGDRSWADHLLLGEIAAPGSPAANRLALYAEETDATDINLTSLRFKDSTGFVRIVGETIEIYARNESGSTITKGQVVYSKDLGSFSTRGTIKVNLARADSILTMPAVGLAGEDIPNNSIGRVIVQGVLTGVDTTGLTARPAYVSSAAAGAFVTTAPAFPNFLQEIGIVMVVGASGAIQVNCNNVVLRDFDGTAQTQFRIGDNTAGNKILSFYAGGIGQLRWNPSAARTMDIPDVSSTIEVIANKGVANGYASLDGSTLVPTAQLGTGAADANKHLRGDRSWADHLLMAEIASPSNPPANSLRTFAKDALMSPGRSTLVTRDEAATEIDLIGDTVFRLTNTTGGIISVGQPVYLKNSVFNNFPDAGLAKADSLTTMPAVGVVATTAANNADFYVKTHGRVTGVDLSAFSVGDILYVSSTVAGGLTNSAPATPQIVGVVVNNTVSGILHVCLHPISGLAPNSATYVTTAAEAGLSNERVLGADVIMEGTLAGRPAASTAGRLYYANDTEQLFRDSGAIWLQIAIRRKANEFLDFPTQTLDPSTPGTDFMRVFSRIATTDDEVLSVIDEEGTIFDLMRGQYVLCRNGSGGTINSGSVVYATGIVIGAVPNIDLARANSITTMPAIGITMQGILNNGFGWVAVSGEVTLDTSGFTAGSVVYVSSAVAGALTSTAPTRPNFIQKMGIVTQSAASGEVTMVRDDIFATLDSTAKVPTAELGTGTANSTTFLRGDRTWAAPPGGGASGTTTLNFDIFPGTRYAEVDVTGQTGILSGSIVEAWLFPPGGTLDHSHDDHLVESRNIKIIAGNIIAGTGFTIYAYYINDNYDMGPPHLVQHQSTGSGGAAAAGFRDKLGGTTSTNTAPRIHGSWRVAWRWS